MAAPAVKVTFTDGHVEEVRLNPRVLVEIERKYGAVPPIEGTLYGAWYRLGRHGSFDEWLDTVEEIAEQDDEPRPTEPEASDGS